MSDSLHTHFSSYREMVLEHLFAGEVMRICWQRSRLRIEMLKSQVDASGYDIVLESGGVMRHIQLKSSHLSSHTARVPINIELTKKPSGCIIWMYFDQDTLKFAHFLWFGGVPNAPLPTLDSFKVATHNKHNAAGVKTERPNIRLVPKAAFVRVDSIEEIVTRLFGEPTIMLADACD